MKYLNKKLSVTFHFFLFSQSSKSLSKQEGNLANFLFISLTFLKTSSWRLTHGEKI